MQKNSYNNLFFLHCNFWLNHMLSLPINLWIYHTRRADTWLPQKFHWNNFRGGYGHPYYTNDWAWLSDWANCWPAWSSYVTIYDHSPFIFMVVHLSLNWTSNCSAHGWSIQEATLPIPCDAVPFLQWHSPSRIGILCPTSLNGYAGYAAMLWIYGCHHWDQAGRPFHNCLGATRFLMFSPFESVKLTIWQNTIPYQEISVRGVDW